MGGLPGRARDRALTPTLLFRFSALTHNAHRIHYDRDYAIDVEAYSGLVVHGPVAGDLAGGAPVDATPRTRIVTSFRFRAVRPAFDGSPLQLRGRLDDGVAVLAAADHHGATTMEAEATFR